MHIVEDMADSTSDQDNNFLKSSAETVNFEDSRFICSICKQTIGDINTNEDLEQALNQASGILIFKSVIILICAACGDIAHIHCYINNLDIEIETLMHVIHSLPYNCNICTKDGAPQ